MLMAQDITARLDEYLETEFSFIRSDELVPLILALVPAEQDFVLDWTRRIASTHTEIAHQFLRRATQALVAHEARIIEAWALHAMDVYDRAGLRDALAVIADIDHFVHYSHVRTAGVLFDEVSGVLQHFVHGLPGRALKLSMGDVSWTDGETIHLPAVMAQLDNKEANFQLCKLMVVMQWAQIHHGTIYTELTADLSVWPDLARAVKIYSLLESLRLESIIARALPGLGRQMEQLEADYISALPANWQDAAKSLQARGATAATSQTLLPSFYKFDLPVARLWHCDLDLEALDACRQARITREKHKLRVQLAQWLAELRRKKPAMNKTVKLAVQQPDENSDYNGPLELTINEAPVIPPRIVQQLLGSIQLDFGGIPPEYLVAAGPGEYDTDEQTTEAEDPDAVWQGTYHEHGALYYNEWDYGRRHYRKNWCVMREKDVVPVYDNFVSDTLRRCSGLVAHLRRSFEAMRDDERLLKRQTEGENVDIDALVEALAEPRPEHLGWDGLTLPKDHPFWQTNAPKNGWGCECYVVGARSEQGARRLGGNPDKQLPDGWNKIDPKTGAPIGIDKGWDYRPGLRAHAIRGSTEKLGRFDPRLQDMALAMAEKTNASWPYDLATAYMRGVPNEARDALAIAYRSLPSVANDTRLYAQRILEGRNHLETPESRTLGIVTSMDAQRIIDASGLNVQGYDYMLDRSSVHKIIKDHGTDVTESPRGQRPVEAADFALLGEILNDHNVHIGEPLTGSGITKRTNHPLIEVRHNVEGEEYTTIWEVRGGRKRLALQTMWVKRRK